MFPSGQCQSCLGILDYPSSEGRGEHRALVFHFTDTATETRRAEVSSLGPHRQRSCPPGWGPSPPTDLGSLFCPVLWPALGKTCVSQRHPLSPLPIHTPPQICPLSPAPALSFSGEPPRSCFSRAQLLPALPHFCLNRIKNVSGRPDQAKQRQAALTGYRSL